MKLYHLYQDGYYMGQIKAISVVQARELAKTVLGIAGEVRAYEQ